MTLIQIWCRKPKARILSHESSFKTNAIWNSLDGKHKRRKRPKGNKLKIISKMVVRVRHIHDNTKCKWVKCTNQKILTGWVDENLCLYAFPITTSLCLTPQTACNYLSVKLVMFPLWLTIVIVMYFLVWLLIMKTDKHLLLPLFLNYYCRWWLQPWN